MLKKFNSFILDSLAFITRTIWNSGQLLTKEMWLGVGLGLILFSCAGRVIG